MDTEKSHRWSWSHSIVIILMLFTFGMSAFLSRSVFEHLPHLEDEVAYLFQAKVFATGAVTAPTPEPRRAYWQPFVVDYQGKRFSKYTPGWSSVLALGVIAGQPWLINALLAAMTVALVYRLGSEIFNHDVGLIAAALTAFSPAALLLNASLMGHTAALCYAAAFIYAYWRIEKGKKRLRWGLLAGLMLGLMLITRPLTAASVALPFVAWSGVRLLKILRPHSLTPLHTWRGASSPLPAGWGGDLGVGSSQARSTQHTALSQRTHNIIFILSPLLLLTACTLLIGLAVPAFNYAATGDASQNLYEMVWSYDKIGFGECCGRNGHTLEKGIRHTRFDLSLTAADLFGWQIGAITPEVTNHWLNESDYFPNTGLSFLLLPFGVAAGLFWRKRHLSDKNMKITPFPPLAFKRGGWGVRSNILILIIWTIGAVFWVWFALQQPPATLQQPNFSWVWILVALAWTLMPLLFAGEMSPAARYTWLLWCVILCMLLLQMTYWIGSQRYSTRYYYEALTAAALLSAIPLAWLMQYIPRALIYGGLTLLLIYSLFSYSLPRVQVLYRFNFIGQHILDEVEARRDEDAPVLVLINGTDTGDNRVRWRAMGTLMAVTSPFFDSDIVVAWDYGGEGVREQILSRFPDRQIIEMDAVGNDAVFQD